MKELRKEQIYLYLGWLVSLIATVGSLYFSEIKGFIPCELCWYQRIFMYPLVIILGVATFQSDHSVKKYVLPTAAIGWCIALYHTLIQKVPALAPVEPCAQGIPCTKDYINWFGFVTIPMLALTAFTIIIVMMLLIRKK